MDESPDMPDESDITMEAESSESQSNDENPEALFPEEAPPKTMPDDYKSKVIGRIITLKEKKGFSIDATVSYLNEKGFKPISNEELWNRDMVSKIFSHINTVRTKRAS